MLRQNEDSFSYVIKNIKVAHLALFQSIIIAPYRRKRYAIEVAIYAGQR